MKLAGYRPPKNTQRKFLRYRHKVATSLVPMFDQFAEIFMTMDYKSNNIPQQSKRALFNTIGQTYNLTLPSMIAIVFNVIFRQS